jgi:hypothetical protein
MTEKSQEDISETDLANETKAPGDAGFLRFMVFIGGASSFIQTIRCWLESLQVGSAEEELQRSRKQRG